MVMVIVNQIDYCILAVKDRHTGQIMKNHKLICVFVVCAGFLVLGLIFNIVDNLKSLKNYVGIFKHILASMPKVFLAVS